MKLEGQPEGTASQGGDTEDKGQPRGVVGREWYDQKTISTTSVWFRCKEQIRGAWAQQGQRDQQRGFQQSERDGGIQVEPVDRGRQTPTHLGDGLAGPNDYLRSLGSG